MFNFFDRKIQLPSVKRSLCGLSNEYKSSTRMGFLTPTYLEECLPSDIIKNFHQNYYFQLAPLLRPIFHKVNIHQRGFFTPTRVVIGEENYKDWLNGEKDILACTFTKESSQDVNPFVNSVLDYLGCDILAAEAVEEAGDDIYVWSYRLLNPIPFFAYLCICRDYYLDSVLQASDFDAMDAVIKGYQTAFAAQAGDYTMDFESVPFDDCFNVSYDKDYFTTARPEPMRGGDIPVLNGKSSLIKEDGTVAAGQGKFLGVSKSTKVLSSGSIGDDSTFNADYKVNVQDSLTIQELWRKEMLAVFNQHNEAFGSRIREQLAAHFGILISDKRLQIPQRICASDSFVQVDTVIQTSSDVSTSPLGNFAGNARASLHSGKFRQYLCEEHGYFISLVSIVPVNGYCRGMARTFFKQNIFDFAFPEFSQIGWQGIYNGEIFSVGDETDKNVFGWQPRYSEYRCHPSRCTGDFRQPTELVWHLNRNFDSVPPLNSNFLKVADTERIFNIQEVEDDPTYAPIYFKCETDSLYNRPITAEPDSIHIY